MAADKVSVMGLFRSQKMAAAAIQEMRGTDFSFERVHSPIHSHTIASALNLADSRVGWFTLAGGITGFFTGFLLAIFTATRWSLVVGGKPVVAWIPFFIVGFEFTILFGVFGNVLGLITLADIPKRSPKRYDPRCTGRLFGVLATCAAEEIDALKAFFTSRGAVVETFEPENETPEDPAGNDDR